MVDFNTNQGIATHYRQTFNEVCTFGNRLGILGGTFDPIHNGHLAAAQAAFSSLDLDAVLFIPAWQPPHKSHRSVLSFSHRCAMLDLALGVGSKFFPCHIEAQRDGPSYTYMTLADLRAILGEEKKLFFITGVDAFLEIHTWKNFGELPLSADFVILGRPPYSQERLGSYIANTFPDFDLVAGEGKGKMSPEQNAFFLVSMPPVAISSTDIRRHAAAGNPIHEYTPVPVVDYITANRLYR